MPAKPAKKSAPLKKATAKKRTKKKKPVNTVVYKTPVVPAHELRAKGLPDKSATDMPLFHKITNWEEMWRDFNLSITPEGRPKYRSLKQFVREVSESDEQTDFLMWFLAAPDETDSRNLQYSFAGKPLDFYKKREQGGWFTDQALKLISKNVLHGTNALEQIQSIGNDSALNQVYRVEKLKQELDKSFSGSFIADGLNAKENNERMMMYLSMHRQLDSLARSAIEQFALTRGINFADMNGYASLMQGLNMSIVQFNGGQPATQKSEVERCINDMVKMTMAKSKLYDLPVPKSLEPETIDVTPEDDKQHHKKNKPN